MLNSIGDDIYLSWSSEKRREEIGNLVKGFRNGLPVQILCQLAAQIAGSPSLAGQHIAAFLPLKERKAIVKKESGDNQELRALLESTLL